MIEILPWFLLIISIFMLVISLYYNYKFARNILKIEDAITDSLDLLDKKYNSVNKILEIPLFYDSPQVRQVITDIRSARDSILTAANLIANIEDVVDEDEEKEN